MSVSLFSCLSLSLSLDMSVSVSLLTCLSLSLSSQISKVHQLSGLLTFMLLLRTLLRSRSVWCARGVCLSCVCVCVSCVCVSVWHAENLRPTTERLYLVKSLPLSLLISLSFSSTLSITMTMCTRPVGCLCTHGPDLPFVQVRGPWPILCWANMLASCKKLMSRYSCASLVPIGMKWGCIYAGRKKRCGSLTMKVM